MVARTCRTAPCVVVKDPRRRSVALDYGIESEPTVDNPIENTGLPRPSLNPYPGDQRSTFHHGTPPIASSLSKRACASCLRDGMGDRLHGG